ncbi:partial Serralysin, partial [Patescibacteria group bacterium]
MTTPSTAKAKSLIIIDSHVSDWKSLIADIDANTPIIILDSEHDGLTQITEQIANYSKLDSIHIISHGSTGSLQLGNSQINQINLADYADTLASIGNALSEQGDILLYGCNVAEGEIGQTFIKQLSVMTNADVAASDDLTGSAVLGGDWNLELVTGNIEAQQAFDGSSSYSNVLLNTDFFSNKITYAVPLSVNFDNPYLNALAWGYKWASNVITYTFDSHGDTLTWGGQDVIKNAIKKALGFYSEVTALDFIFTTDPSQATLKFNLVSHDWIENYLDPNHEDDSITLGMMNPPDRASIDWRETPGTMLLVDPTTIPDYTYLNWDLGGDNFNTIVHELGHGLGLAHPHDTGGSSGIFPGITTVVGTYGDDTVYDASEYGDYELNQSVYSVMSYNYGFNNVLNFSSEWGTAITPMALDIATLQAIYGVNNNNILVELGDRYDLPQTNEAGTGFICIWDAGGIDEIAYYGSGNATIDLRAATIDATNQSVIGEHTGGYISRVTDTGIGDDGIAGGFTIAHGVVIENARGGYGDDILIGNDANNNLDGRYGIDIMIGGKGNDIYNVDDINDVISENVNEGWDVVYSSVDYILSPNIEVLRLTFMARNGLGNSNANRLFGTWANNILNGGLGADTMDGGASDDIYVVDNTGDVIVETGLSDKDSVLSSVSYTLSANLYALVLTGNSDLYAIGNASNNVLQGNDGNNFLSGAAGADTLIGGKGDDTYAIDNLGDTVQEAIGEGSDTVRLLVNDY